MELGICCYSDTAHPMAPSLPQQHQGTGQAVGAHLRGMHTFVHPPVHVSGAER